MRDLGVFHAISEVFLRLCRSQMAPNRFSISNINWQSRKWMAEVMVAEKSLPKIPSGRGRPYQMLILQDIEGKQVQATIFGNDINLLSNTLKIYHTYSITNATVNTIAEH
ncbi:hypothetical protein RHMOL_Rhmol04G0211500 [Rhododendron molle]|uniref:Uncharacterized protein n=3 Tax=Rhododendron molle TaxID=49168 RepID=A0ACC0P2R3_RHOML|nr:hypothetical protein RHMOL_Rhmol04G0211500 [Rhododendron molle]KAI8559896.1 hypothetical protein RHMOL_Rhmol04G0211500 [Rhododendron molle]KAI8559897.1 hypothetical protein RHMOL_Rhmol04G0211500 [Rhododendron molle]